MHHTCYHLVSDHKNQFLNSISDVKSTVDSWKKEGEKHIKIFRIKTEELESDAIDLEEKQISEDDASFK